MQTQEITIYGIVVPTDWDDQGNILKIAIATYDEGKIIVAPDDRGLALMSCLRKTVQARGILRQNNGSREMEIHTFAMDRRQH
ncbi:hypothetical protein HRM2_13270 [Desulforapulum autotrophicum HRM2]|uniref:Uncharacterized protein n=1 Tax=Desulforapulum autotrophicum (strain ATCC 43914 / DSM 3382 / VKM B-1955 / HRM2) TaxID=177437 RepID=C0Q8U8_DESAH|nr:hypothetical protein [Desulforapulum autotrophicum]ACN14438.1 hypothetical protein HRM2_13270 [Desulforapulum autotrophicum HRM2]